MEQLVKLNACLRNSIQLAVVHFRISTWHVACHQWELESFANWIHNHLSEIKHSRHNTSTCFTSQITLKSTPSNNKPWHIISITFLYPIYSHPQMKVISLIYDKCRHSITGRHHGNQHKQVTPTLQTKATKLNQNKQIKFAPST